MIRQRRAARPTAPRSRPHRFVWDQTSPIDHTGQLVCRCGSADGASVHRRNGWALTIDLPALAAGDDDDDQADGVLEQTDIRRTSGPIRRTELTARTGRTGPLLPTRRAVAVALVDLATLAFLILLAVLAWPLAWAWSR